MEIPNDLTTSVAPRVVDLRSEFEAQMRAVGRLQEQLTNTLAGQDSANRKLADVMCRELAEMLKNNKNIRDVLLELSAATGARATEV